jgi:hypothetical protein
MCEFQTYAGPFGVAAITILHYDKGNVRINSMLSSTLDRMVVVWHWSEAK